VKRERDRERNKIHARESRARKKRKIEDLEQKCRSLEARKQEILIQEETYLQMKPMGSIEELRIVISGLMAKLDEQSSSLMMLERDNQILKHRLAQTTGQPTASFGTGRWWPDQQPGPSSHPSEGGVNEGGGLGGGGGLVELGLSNSGMPPGMPHPSHSPAPPPGMVAHPYPFVPQSHGGYGQGGGGIPGGPGGGLGATASSQAVFLYPPGLRAGGMAGPGSAGLGGSVAGDMFMRHSSSASYYPDAPRGFSSQMRMPVAPPHPGHGAPPPSALQSAMASLREPPPLSEQPSSSSSATEVPATASPFPTARRDKAGEAPGSRHADIGKGQDAGPGARRTEAEQASTAQWTSQAAKPTPPAKNEADAAPKELRGQEAL